MDKVNNHSFSEVQIILHQIQCQEILDFSVIYNHKVHQIQRTTQECLYLRKKQRGGKKVKQPPRASVILTQHDHHSLIFYQFKSILSKPFLCIFPTDTDLLPQASCRQVANAAANKKCKAGDNESELSLGKSSLQKENSQIQKHSCLFFLWSET